MRALCVQRHLYSAQLPLFSVSFALFLVWILELDNINKTNVIQLSVRYFGMVSIIRTQSLHDMADGVLKSFILQLIWICLCYFALCLQLFFFQCVSARKKKHFKCARCHETNTTNSNTFCSECRHRMCLEKRRFFVSRNIFKLVMIFIHSKKYLHRNQIAMIICSTTVISRRKSHRHMSSECDK